MVACGLVSVVIYLSVQYHPNYSLINVQLITMVVDDVDIFDLR